MNEDNSVQEIQPALIPKMSSASNSEEANKTNRQFSRVQKRDNQDGIAIDEVMKIFNQMSNPENAKQDVYIKKLQRKNLIKKQSNRSGGRQKREGRFFNGLQQKTLSIIDDHVSKYKYHLSSNGNIFDPKTGYFRVQLFRYTMIGVFELRGLLRQQKHDLTPRQKNIAAADTDIFEWSRRIVEQFDKQFKHAQFQKRLGIQLKKKWEILISHCKDQSNQSLRRGLANRSINAKKVIIMREDDLMSAQKKKQRDRQLKKILMESQIDFQKQNQEEMRLKQKQRYGQLEAELPQDDIPQLNYYSPIKSSQDLNLLQKQSQTENLPQSQKEKEKEKIMEYMQIAFRGSHERLKRRLVEDLNNTDSFEKLYQDYIKVFGNYKRLQTEKK